MSTSPVTTTCPAAHANRNTPHKQWRRRLFALSFFAALIGLAGGVAAYWLYSLINLLTNLVFFHRFSFEHANPALNTMGLWVIPLPAIGGLIVGLMAKYGSPKIRGHGIPEAMEAILFNQSRIPPRMAWLKPTSVAIAIGTGAPFGAEGPIIVTGGAIGSTLGQALHLTAPERKVLLASGAAAGMAATFSTPLAAVMLAIELLLFEYKARSFIPLVIASTLATAVRLSLLGHDAMFTVGTPDFQFPSEIVWYLPLGIAAGLTAIALSRSLYKIEDCFEKIPTDPLWWPVMSGLIIGVIGYFVPRVLGIGYDTISDILNAHLALGLLAVIFIAKATSLVFALGSGTSGGILAPTFMIGAAMGGFFASVCNHLFPGAHLSVGAFALVGMAAVFGSAARAPFTLIIFAFELTRDYDSVLPLMLAVVVAHFVTLMFMENSILTEKLARRGLHVHQEYEVDVFQQVAVSSVMDKKPTILPATLTTGELARRLSARDPGYVQHQAFLLVDSKGELAGIITRHDLMRALERDQAGKITLIEAGTSNPEVALPGETLSDALMRMKEQECGRLPVVSPDNPKQIVGYLGRAAILDAWFKRIHEEQHRQPGWIKLAERFAKSR